MTRNRAIALIVWVAIPVLLLLSPVSDSRAADVVVWILVFTAVIQGGIHLTLYAVMRGQRSQTRVGKVLEKRELTLGLENLAATGFRLILAVAVTGGVILFTPSGRLLVYYALASTAIAACWYGLKLVHEMKDEQWGKAIESRNARDDRQDAREDGLDERAVGLDARGWDMSKRSILQNAQKRQLDQRDQDGKP